MSLCVVKQKLQWINSQWVPYRKDYMQFYLQIKFGIMYAFAFISMAVAYYNEMLSMFVGCRSFYLAIQK